MNSSMIRMKVDLILVVGLQEVRTLIRDQW